MTKVIAGKTLDQWKEFARRDDCLDQMVPSDLRQLLGEIVGGDEPAMTKREALEKAYERMNSVVNFCLDLGLEPDKMDKESIRTAHEMLRLALK